VRSAAEFKDSRITTSNWGQEILAARQVLYAAFDVVALYVAYPNFPPLSANIRCDVRPNVRLRKKIRSERLVRPTFSYILKGFTGNRLPSDLRSLFENLDL
jgi:hypothetical protein